MGALQRCWILYSVSGRVTLLQFLWKSHWNIGYFDFGSRTVGNDILL
jgi:hypothetical protein